MLLFEYSVAIDISSKQTLIIDTEELEKSKEYSKIARKTNEMPSPLHEVNSFNKCQTKTKY